MQEGPTMTLLMYILIGVILVAALFFIVRGKKN
jgi:LPXTG-motif cell wall-anchored protein